MAVAFLAHAADPATWPGTTLAAVAIALLGIVLVVEHSYVQHGRITARNFRVPATVVLTLSLVAVVAPNSGSAQSDYDPVGLPDLISDPPFIWFIRDLDIAEQPARVMAFDGYIHNIGTGSLDLLGNPQIPGGVKQRVFDGEEWEEVGAPTVRFENDDGHNHFHLIEAVDYSLWDEGRFSEIGEASKVGFCLIDTEQMESVADAFYDIADTDYCGVDSPDATSLSMGITPGWRDTYDAATTLQWVDISNVRPARYWVAAITDPNNEIVESNEDNNDTIFSGNKFAVPGYVARSLEVQTAGEPIELLSSTFGTVGARVFTIVDGPTNGRLNVPDGVDFVNNVVEYTPDPGFTGEDSFHYAASDVTSGFPLEPTVIEVVVAVATPVGSQQDDANADEIVDANLGIREVASQSGQLYRPIDLTLELDDATTDTGSWFASDLPHGLVIDAATGTISGYPTVSGSFTSTIIAVGERGSATTTIDWDIAFAEIPTLEPVNNFSTTSTDVLRMHLGTGDPAARYEASGVPSGTRMVENVPLLTGEPEDFGDFEIEVREIVDDQVVNTISFVWTIRPSVHPAFPL